jgi:hypothetical protein
VASLQAELLAIHDRPSQTKPAIALCGNANLHPNRQNGGVAMDGGSVADRSSSVDYV